jgi:prophage DNA circulation protein
MGEFGHWNASFRGVPFHVESDQESGGRRVAVHEFPLRDDPFLEDLGEAPRKYEVTAYVAADSGNAAATQGRVAALLAALSANGASVLVLPLAGPRQARCTEFRRAFERDRLGYAAITATFIREGAGLALASLAQLANEVFSAADNLVAAASSLMSSAALLVGFPAHVAAAAVGAFEDLVATFDTVRDAATVDADASAAARDSLSDLFNDAPALLTRAAGVDATAVAGLADAVRGFAGAMGAAEAVAAFGGLADAPPVTVGTGSTASAIAIARNSALIARVGRLVTLAAYADGLARMVFVARPDGITARADAATRFSFALAEASSALDEPVVSAVQELAGKIADLLSREIATLAPVVSVVAPGTMPAIAWAWRLYADPDRAVELVNRNGVKHAAFMPTTFEALAS